MLTLSIFAAYAEPQAQCKKLAAATLHSLLNHNGFRITTSAH